ncbi:MAG TPA: hypothetical protein VKZ68_04540 [Ohtaekwangia sp.]|nr:hypothetical protein [Ohtaekwangia sp.]
MENRDKEHHDKQRERQTPIIDGDARPDINLNPEDTPEKEKAAQKDKGKTTKNRVDTNSLEDFRDAKEG